VIVKVLSKVLFLTLVLGGSGILVLAGDAMPSRFKLLEADVKAYQLFPEAFAARAGAALPVDESGLIGRNRQWGAFFSPRFQLGAGAALRTAIAAGRIALFQCVYGAGEDVPAVGVVVELIDTRAAGRQQHDIARLRGIHGEMKCPFEFFMTLVFDLPPEFRLELFTRLTGEHTGASSFGQGLAQPTEVSALGDPAEN